MAALLFPLGRVVATPAALEALARAGQNPNELLDRHQGGDWGEVPSADAKENDLSVRAGYRIVSSYPVGAGQVWLITEADRSSTCILLPEDY